MSNVKWVSPHPNLLSTAMIHLDSNTNGGEKGQSSLRLIGGKVT